MPGRNLVFFLILRVRGDLPAKQSFLEKSKKTLDLSLLKVYLVSKRLLDVKVQGFIGLYMPSDGGGHAKLI